MADLNELNIKITAEAEKAVKKFEELADSMSKVKDTINKMDFSKLKSGFKSLNDSLAGKAFKGAVAAVSLTAIGKAAVKATANAVTFTQTINSMNVIMGEGAKEAQDFAYKLQDAIMLDPSATMSMQNSLYSVIKGFGNTSVAAQNMSKNLTQLSYDLSIARYDILGGNAEEAANRLRMALAGTIEPLQRMGFAIKEADLKMVAAKHGYDVNIRNLDSATKAQLRYMAIMEQSSKMQGYYAQNINTPAVALANLKNSVHQISVEIGKTFIPILNATLPYIRAVVKGILTMIKTFNSLIGIKTEDLVNTKTLGSASNELEQIGDNAQEAGKKLKKSFMLGIDELNVLDNSASSAADSLDTTHIDFDLSGYDYDMLEGLDQEKIQEIEDKLAPLQPLFDGIAQAAAGFVNALKEFTGGPLYDFLVSVGDWMADHPETMEKLGEGLFYVAAGLIALKAIKSLANVLGIPALVKGLGDAWTKLNAVYGITYAMDGKTWTGWSLLATRIAGVALLALSFYSALQLVKSIIDVKNNEIEGWEAFRQIVGWTAMTIGAAGLALSAFGLISATAISGAILAIGLLALNWEDFCFGAEYVFATLVKIVAGLLHGLLSTIVTIATSIIYGIVGVVEIVLYTVLGAVELLLNGLITGVKKVAEIIDKVAGTDWSKNINAKVDLTSGLSKTMEEQKQRYVDIQKGMWGQTADIFTADVLDSPYMQNAMDIYNESKANKAKKSDKGSIETIVDELKKLFEDSKAENKEQTEEIEKLTNQQADLSQISSETSKQLEAQNISNEKVENLKAEIQNLSSEQLNLGETANSISDLNQKSFSTEESTYSLLKLVGDNNVSALAKVQEACENIKINVENNYYGGGDGYATGGYPTSGEYFFAREDGLPEMVGRVGNKTAVMNNGQVADTMAQSLVRAMSQSGASSNEPTVIENKLYLDGEVVYNNQQKIQRSKGYSLGLGVFANV